MSTKGWIATATVAILVSATLLGCSNGNGPFQADVQSIKFETQVVPPADAGRLYNVVIMFTSTGNAALPDRFELTSGVLPAGVMLERDREDTDFDGLPNEDGAYTGYARLLGVPRERGSYSFTIKAISTGALTGSSSQPDLAATQNFAVNVGQGTVAILTPTDAEGTSDPAVPAFPTALPFVNPANPSAFFSWAFQIAGGSNNNIARVYMPRELELSAFDAAVVDDATLRQDTDENLTGNAPTKWDTDISDGGMFTLQAGMQKVQIGGFQSPRGPVMEDTNDDGVQDTPFLQGLLTDWFQDAGVPKNSRRDFGDSLGLAGGDNTLGATAPILFTDYFDPGYKQTWSPGNQAKYPFTEDQYVNAFFVPFQTGVDLTPLQFRLIVEAIDTRGTPLDRTDDVITRKSYVFRVQIPDLVIDTVYLPSGQTGVPYNAVVALNGGVPPLFADLEWVDGTNDIVGGQWAPRATPGDPLTKQLFGLELDPKLWTFIGAPRASAPDSDPSNTAPDIPAVELTIRAWAQVMNPTQSGTTQVPTGNFGEFDGTSPVTGKTGRHKTIPVNFEMPTTPVITNNAIAAGIDGFGYPGDRIQGVGGVPLLAPYPVGFFDTNPGAVYPSSSARESYQWDASYIQDSSPGHTPGQKVSGLPNNLTLVTSAQVATNGNITGTTYDRGFLPCEFMGWDFYVGPSTAPVATPIDPGGGAYGPPQTDFYKTLTLSVSPDNALYLRGVQSSEASGGESTGLFDAKGQTGESRMVPIILAAGLFTADTGQKPVLFEGLPLQFDILPVLMPNAGSDVHNRMSQPQVRGFWPVEANKEPIWPYYYYYGQEPNWRHLQQELTWLQSPDKDQTRVFMWAEESTVRIHNSGTWNQTFQQLDPDKRRGVLVEKPLTGDFFVPVILDPNDDLTYGILFGGEVVIAGRNTSSTGTYGYIEGGFYTKYYYYPVRDTQHDRYAHIHGGGTYLQQYSSTSNSSAGYYMQSLGRTATSVTMSADGLWCATAIVGGTNEQKILLWRTDHQPIPSAILSQSYVLALDGVNADGSTFSNSACIIRPASAGAGLNTSNRYLFPDSLTFVENGLLFLSEYQLNRVYGVSLVDGHVSYIDINSSRQQVNSAGYGPSVSSSYGQYPPDNDHLRGCIGSQGMGAQFSFTGNKPAPGEAGPNRVAFVAGSATYFYPLTDLPSSTHPRSGYVYQGNANKSLFYMELDTAGGSGLNLSTSTLRDLTGSDSDVYGDLLSPGRFGEEMDFLVLSDDGAYAAVVREQGVTGYYPSSYYGYYGSFHCYYPYINSGTSYSGWFASHDLLVISTSGADMHSGSGSQHVLFIGTGTFEQSSPKGGMPSWAVQQGHIYALGRRVNGLTFAPDGKTLIFNYAGEDYYNPCSGYGSAINWQAFNPAYTSYGGCGAQVSISFTFRDDNNDPVNFSSTSNFKNNLDGLSPGTAIGGGAPWGEIDSGQCFWATFKSENGNFMYLVSDQIDSSTGYTTSNRNFMVGFNISANTIGDRDPFKAFSPHPNTVGFEQFDCNSWNYENRFAATPGGMYYNGRDGAGILCVIASDASAGAGSATDLEVYVMDANMGTDLVALTSAVTTGTANAINHLYLSANGNVLAGQVAPTSSTTRAVLNNKNNIFVVTNIHEVLAGGTPNAINVSENMSHGATVAFVGDGSPGGPQAIIFSSGPASSSNSSWTGRSLKAAPLVSGATASVLDSVNSHYVVLAGGRKIDDNPNTSD